MNKYIPKEVVLNEAISELVSWLLFISAWRCACPLLASRQGQPGDLVA